MKTPDKIYISPNIENRTWLIGKADVGSVEYIRKDALLKWAKEMLHKVEVKSNDGDVFSQGMHAGFGATISKITNLWHKKKDSKSLT